MNRKEYKYRRNFQDSEEDFIKIVCTFIVWNHNLEYKIIIKIIVKI